MVMCGKIALALKGRWKSYKLTKVKGHATDQQVAQGLVPMEQKIGNDGADNGATHARKAQRENYFIVCKALQERNTKATQLTKAVQDMMLQILDDTRIFRNQILDTVDVTSNHRKALVEITALPVPTYQDLRRIRMGGTTWLGKAMASWQLRLAQWLEKWEWLDENTTDDHKLTWIELLIAFEIDTDTTVPDNQMQIYGTNNGIKPKMCVGQLTSHFKTVTTDLLENYFTADARRLFNNKEPWNAERAKRLICLGITGQWAATNTWAKWPHQLREKVDEILLLLRGVTPRGKMGWSRGPFW